MDPGFLIFSLIIAVATTYTIRMIVHARMGRSSEKPRLDREAVLQGDERMRRLEQAVDAIAFEVERISEGQRFTTRLLSEQANLPGAAPRQARSTNTPH